MLLPVLDTDHISIEEQKEHVRQEFIEFLEADTKENKIEEFYDIIQVMLSQLFKEGIQPLELQQGIFAHVNKLNKRQWETKGFISL
jgi:hypothetical protein